MGCWPKFTFSPFTRDPNLHNPHLRKTQIYTTPNLHRPQIYTTPDLHNLKFTKPTFTQTQIYTASIIHKAQIYTDPNFTTPKFASNKAKHFFTLCKLGAIQFGRVSQALVDTRFECGLRLPKALRACESLECRTRFERWDLTKGG